MIIKKGLAASFFFFFRFLFDSHLRVQDAGTKQGVQRSLTLWAESHVEVNIVKISKNSLIDLRVSFFSPHPLDVALWDISLGVRLFSKHNFNKDSGDRLLIPHNLPSCLTGSLGLHLNRENVFADKTATCVRCQRRIWELPDLNLTQLCSTQCWSRRVDTRAPLHEIKFTRKLRITMPSSRINNCLCEFLDIAGLGILLQRVVTERVLVCVCVFVCACRTLCSALQSKFTPLSVHSLTVWPQMRFLIDSLMQFKHSRYKTDLFLMREGFSSVITCSQWQPDSQRSLSGWVPGRSRDPEPLISLLVDLRRGEPQQLSCSLPGSLGKRWQTSNRAPAIIIIFKDTWHALIA